MSINSFADLGLSETLLRAVNANGYTQPTPIQARTIPMLLQGRDVLGIAQTGTGKTAAFALPVLQHLAAENRRAEPKSPRCLVLAPTRELAVQIGRSFDTYGRGLGLRLGMVIGGLGFGRQIDTLQKGVDILVATPGRLIDLMEQRHVRLQNVTFLVLDEADRMFDMGFIRDVRRIVASVSKQRQTLLFSATMPGDVAKLASEILKNPERVEIAPQGRTIEKIDQGVYFVNSATKRALLSHLLADAALERVIVFTRTKRGANRVAEVLEKNGVRSEAIHGNKSQNARQKALDNFSRGKARVLVATDLASRGIDVQGVTHVINYELPADAESYVHRIGRTARAGASGIAISFCDGSERGQLKGIERLTNQRIAVLPTPANEDLPQVAAAPATTYEDPRREQRGGHRGGHRSEGRGGHRNGPPRHRKFGERSRPEGEQPRGERPGRDWAQGDFRDQAAEPRQHDERPHHEHRGDRPNGHGGEGHRDGGHHRHGGHHHGGHRNGGQHGHGHHSAERGAADHGDRAGGDRPHGEGGFAARAKVKRPYTPRPDGDRPFGGPPRGNTNGRHRFGGGGGARGRGRAA